MTDHQRISPIPQPSATVKLPRKSKGNPLSPTPSSHVFEDIGFFHEPPQSEPAASSTFRIQELYAANPFAGLCYFIERILGEVKEDLRARFNLTRQQVLYFEFDIPHRTREGYTLRQTVYSDDYDEFELILDNLIERNRVAKEWRNYYLLRQGNLLEILKAIKTLPDIYLTKPEAYETSVKQIRKLIADIGNRFPHVKKVLKQLDKISPSKLSKDIEFLDEQITKRQNITETTTHPLLEQNAIDVLKKEKLNNEITLLRLQRYFEPDEQKQNEMELNINHKKIACAQLQLKIAVAEEQQANQHIHIMLEDLQQKHQTAQTKLGNLITQDKNQVWTYLVEPLLNAIDKLKNIPAALQDNLVIHHKELRLIHQANFGTNTQITLTYLRSLVDLHNMIHNWLQTNRPGFFARLFGWYTPEYAEMMALSKKMYSLLDKQKQSDYYAYLRAGKEVSLERIPFKRPELIRCQREVVQAQTHLNQEYNRLLKPFKQAIASKQYQLKEIQLETTTADSPLSVGSASPDTPRVAM